MKTKETFSLQIDAVFDIHGQGIIVTGRVETGKIKTGDLLKISGNNIELSTKCLKLQKYLRPITEAAAGRIHWHHFVRCFQIADQPRYAIIF